jgi:ubiquinone/menaquinone biosynthesis C-methylase UbiE
MKLFGGVTRLLLNEHSQSLGIRAFYDREGSLIKRYDSTNFWERRYHKKKANLVFYILNSIIKRNDLVLDAGCGSGELGIFAEQAGCLVVSLDISKSYLKRLQGLVKNRICASADHLPFKQNAFDIVLSADVIEHLFDYHKAIDEIYRVSAGYVVISTPCDGVTRQLFSRIFPKKLKCLDEKVGHLNIWSLSEFTDILLRTDWIVQCRSYHVAQPILNEHFFPKKLGLFLDLAEKIADASFPTVGTISIALVKPKYKSIINFSLNLGGER